ncbi:MAG: energy-coupling factor ABC transporter ATP-binding protein [Chloroflexota bacterium]|nr:energy-coupling factor ABC transporter ATP-binding protein [Chloroflexota bacterium]
MLTLDSVSYRYAGADRPSLYDVDLQLADGEVVGVVGASESGKTTLCLVASGLAPRAIRGTLSGRLLIDGQDVVDARMHELMAHTGVCFQDPATQLSGVTGSVFEEVAFGPMNLGLPLDEVLSRTQGALVVLGIDHLSERDPARLSGGQMQLVAIGGLLAMRPAHLILDEPTAQLDPAGTLLVADALASLASRGTSILISEQKTDLLARICDRVIALEQGRIQLSGPADATLAAPALESLGVAAPSAVRLRRSASVAGVDPARIEAGLP